MSLTEGMSDVKFTARVYQIRPCSLQM